MCYMTIFALSGIRMDKPDVYISLLSIGTVYRCIAYCPSAHQWYPWFLNPAFSFLPSSKYIGMYVCTYVLKPSLIRREVFQHGGYVSQYTQSLYISYSLSNFSVEVAIIDSGIRPSAVNSSLSSNMLKAILALCHGDGVLHLGACTIFSC